MKEKTSRKKPSTSKGWSSNTVSDSAPANAVPYAERAKPPELAQEEMGTPERPVSINTIGSTFRNILQQKAPGAQGVGHWVILPNL